MERAWHDDDNMWVTMGPLMFTPKSVARAPGEVGQVIALLGLAPGCAILDLGCGVGRHALEFARQGFRVTGVDRTAAFVEQARQLAVAEDLAVELLVGDMREFVRDESFDAILSMLTSFSYFEDPAENLRVLENAHRSLRPGGKLILETAGKEILARIFRERDWHEVPGGFWLQERQVSDDWSRMNNRWILIRDGQAEEFRLRHWVYAATELADMFRAAGFGQVAIYGGLDGSPYDLHARRLVAVGLKVPGAHHESR